MGRMERTWPPRSDKQGAGAVRGHLEKSGRNGTFKGEEAEVSERIDALIEWREQVGVRLMHAMKCTHEGGDFGSRAVCVTCFDNVQRVGAVLQSETAWAWDKGRAAERRDWVLTDDLATPDEDRKPLANPYRLVVEDDQP